METAVLGASIPNTFCPDPSLTDHPQVNSNSNFYEIQKMPSAKTPSLNPKHLTFEPPNPQKPLNLQTLEIPQSSHNRPSPETPQAPEACYRVAFREFNFSYYIGETALIITYPLRMVP